MKVAYNFFSNSLILNSNFFLLVSLLGGTTTSFLCDQSTSNENPISRNYKGRTSTITLSFVSQLFNDNDDNTFCIKLCTWERVERNQQTFCTTWISFTINFKRCCGKLWMSDDNWNKFWSFYNVAVWFIFETFLPSHFSIFRAVKVLQMNIFCLLHKGKTTSHLK